MGWGLDSNTRTPADGQARDDAREQVPQEHDLGTERVSSNPIAEDWTPTDFYIEIEKKFMAMGKVHILRGIAPPGEAEHKVQAWLEDQK